MAYLRSKKIKGNTYYYVVEGKLEKGKVKQKVKLYLGNIDNIIRVFNNSKKGA
jgi:selenocysteine-specific translation elongation factor